jgi:hypothetical protein
MPEMVVWHLPAWLCVENPEKASNGAPEATAELIGFGRALVVTIGTDSRVQLFAEAFREAVAASAPLSKAVAPVQSHTS